MTDVTSTYACKKQQWVAQLAGEVEGVSSLHALEEVHREALGPDRATCPAPGGGCWNDQKAKGLNVPTLGMAPAWTGAWPRDTMSSHGGRSQPSWPWGRQVMDPCSPPAYTQW